MKIVTLDEFCRHARHYLDLLESGDSVRVLRDGRPLADVVPIAGDIPQWKRREARPLSLDRVSISRLILEERQGKS